MLLCLENNKLGQVSVDTLDSGIEPFAYQIGDIFRENVAAFKKEILFVSESFAKASIEARTSLASIILQELTEDLTLSQTTVIGDITCCFSITERLITIFLFKKVNKRLLGVYHTDKDNEDKNFIWLSKTFREHGLINTNEEMLDYFNKCMAENVLISTFKKYAQVEEKILPPKKKTKDMHCKYVNDTSLQITHLDSKWFTDIVQSNGFKVRGHFRLQPYKHTKKLIWISDFAKTGYTSKAKVKPLS